MSLLDLADDWSPDPDMVAIPRERDRKDMFNENVAPPEGYEPPDSYVSIAGLKQIGLDCETYDPDLKTKGPGAHRKEGFICGLGIGPRTNIIYYPVRHRRDNITFVDAFWDTLRRESAEFTGEVVGANLQYDLDWLGTAHGVFFKLAKISDVQIAEPLLDENRLSYKLNVLTKHYLGESKLSADLSGLYGEAFILHMHKVHPGHAGPYCCADISLSMDVLAKQKVRLAEEGLTDLFDVESRLIPLLLRMRSNGVRVDIPKIEVAYEQLKIESVKVSDEITTMAGVPVDVWSGDSIAHAFDKLEIGYPRTAQGRPSFVRAWLEAHHNPLAQLIVKKRGFEKIGGTFLESYILNGHINGRIHCMFNQLRSDEGGTVSGRFSSSYPNLQNIPTRDPILGPMCRSGFIPEEGMDWLCADWSQIEYRLLVHYAVSSKKYLTSDEYASALKAQQMYVDDKGTDFHALAAKLSGVDRGRAKNINFGVVYGMGVTTMAHYLGCSLDEAKVILAGFHSEMPFLKGIFKFAERIARERGEIKTLLGRHRRFNVFEAIYQKEKFFGESLEADAWLVEKGGGYMRRAFTHKALNALLQGGNADLMKAAMVKSWEDGVFDVLVPHLTVHDELDVSKPRTKEADEAMASMLHTMENLVPLKVPVFVSAKCAANWDAAK